MSSEESHSKGTVGWSTWSRGSGEEFKGTMPVSLHLFLGVPFIEPDLGLGALATFALFDAFPCFVR